MPFPSKKIEKRIFEKKYDNIIAVDEVGIGSLAGPVVVCAILFNINFFCKKYRQLRGLKESKLLSSIQREKFAANLKNIGLKYSITYTYPNTIDRINIHLSANKSMSRAVKKLNNELGIMNKNQESKSCNSKLMIHNSRTIVLVDGRSFIKDINNDQIPIIKGDQKVFSIACASILAKVYRDKMMVRYAKKFPDYGFEKHKGYGTKHHIGRLMSIGPCEIHRKSFAPVSKLI